MLGVLWWSVETSGASSRCFTDRTRWSPSTTHSRWPDATCGFHCLQDEAQWGGVGANWKGMPNHSCSMWQVGSMDERWQFTQTINPSRPCLGNLSVQLHVAYKKWLCIWQCQGDIQKRNISTPGRYFIKICFQLQIIQNSPTLRSLESIWTSHTRKPQGSLQKLLSR